MGDWLREYIEQLKELMGNLNRRAKIIIGIGVVAVVLSLLFLIIWSGNIQYQSLFSQLDPKDADAIIKKLDEAGIPYKLTDGGRTILVPADKVHKTRLEMAGAGLPSQGIVGFEIFDQSKFGTTDFERRVNFYRALSGELSRSIQAMDAVDFAKVQITAPKDSLFIEEAKPAEASVLLKLKPGYRLKESQVRAITNLVASSVPELEPEKVTIVDTAGNLLTGSFASKSHYSTQLTFNQFEIQRKFEEALKSDLKALLTKVLGPDNFTVQVKAKLNFDQREVESKEYTPVVGDEGIVRSQQEQHEKYQGMEAGAQGVPGTTSNIPQYQMRREGSEGGSYESSDVITNYEINEKIERHVYAPGEVERLSVAVIVNDLLQPEALQKIKDVVHAAIGYDTERGDKVTVTSLAFDNTLQQEIARVEAAAREAERTRMYIYAGLIALISIILLLLFLVFRRSKRPAGEELVPGKAIDFMVGDEAEDELAATVLTEEDKKRQQLKEEIAEMISERPEEVAQLLKSWLMDE